MNEVEPHVYEFGVHVILHSHAIMQRHYLKWEQQWTGPGLEQFEDEPNEPQVLENAYAMIIRTGSVVQGILNYYWEILSNQISKPK